MAGFHPLRPRQTSGSTFSEVCAFARCAEPAVHLQKVGLQHREISRYDIQPLVDLRIKGTEGQRGGVSYRAYLSPHTGRQQHPKETCQIGKALTILQTLGIKLALTPPATPAKGE